MPTHKHDCSDCTFIKTVQHIQGKRRLVDVYRCPQDGFPTWVARYGDEGPEYTSLAESMASDIPYGTDPFYDLLKPLIFKTLERGGK